ncbi:MAG: hypothetical protein H0S82_00370 [Anaerolineaceae bacterium]|nr:hypothetical protein [Anaerolineaceae bacterium]
MKTINASDLGAYLYCQRAWWYRKEGVESGNQEAMAAGTRHHTLHGRMVFIAGGFRLLGWILLLAGLVILTLYLSLTLFGT